MGRKRRMGREEKEKKGGGGLGKRKREGLFLWRSDEKVKGVGFELVKENGMERKR